MAQKSRRIRRSEETVLRDTRESRSTGSIDSIDIEVALRAARSNCTILITGETGSGKGHLARWLHEHSERKDGPFVPINCGAIPDNLIDSQLFGHMKGAFSGASSDHPGLVRAATGGTLLLDEVSELPPSAQTRLLRLLEEREIQPVGGCHPIIVNVRVLAATNRDLQKVVDQELFREDLLFRLNVIRLNVRPLRERRDEIDPLVQQFNQEFATFYRQDCLQFEDHALAFLMSYHWPGNIRQLRILVERLHVLSPSKPVTIQTLLEVGQLESVAGSAAFANIEQVRLQELERVLAAAGGNISRAANQIGVHRSTIYRWLKLGTDANSSIE